MPSSRVIPTSGSNWKVEGQEDGDGHRRPHSRDGTDDDPSYGSDCGRQRDVEPQELREGLHRFRACRCGSALDASRGGAVHGRAVLRSGLADDGQIERLRSKRWVDHLRVRSRDLVRNAR